MANINSRVLTVLLCAFLISIAASLLVYRLATASTSSPQAPQTRIVVAARDLAIGTILQGSDLKWAAWVGEPLKGWSLQQKNLLNRGVVAAIYEGEPVIESRLALPGSGGGLAATIPTGMRACAVKVNEVVGVAGFAIPGMRVDVLVTGLQPGLLGLPEATVKTLLQNIQVLSAGANIDKDREGKPQQAQVVNLLVTPAEAELLSLAGNETKIQLVLRNPMDTIRTEPPGSVMSKLFGISGDTGPAKARVAVKIASPRAGTPVPPAAQKNADASVVETIDVMNGSVRTQARFPAPEATPAPDATPGPETKP